MSGQQDSVTAGSYTLLINQWGWSHATSGYDCAALTSLIGMTIAWSNSWKWEGDNKIKSYTNMQLNQDLNKRLSAIKDMPVCFL
jgi:xyloglucan-specific endo-beta-1,4-glucanase